jgi:hypothetical protein
VALADISEDVTHESSSGYLTYRRPTKKTTETAHFLRVGMFKPQMMNWGIMTRTKSDEVLITAAAMLTALLSVHAMASHYCGIPSFFSWIAHEDLDESANHVEDYMCPQQDVKCPERDVPNARGN